MQSRDHRWNFAASIALTFRRSPNMISEQPWLSATFENDGAAQAVPGTDVAFGRRNTSRMNSTGFLEAGVSRNSLQAGNRSYSLVRVSRASRKRCVLINGQIRLKLSGEAWHRFRTSPFLAVSLQILSCTGCACIGDGESLYIHIHARARAREYHRASASARPPWKMDFNLISAVQKHAHTRSARMHVHTSRAPSVPSTCRPLRPAHPSPPGG